MMKLPTRMKIINKLTKSKKHINDSSAKSNEDLQASTDKVGTSYIYKSIYQNRFIPIS